MFPSRTDIEMAAYYHWARQGRSHGHDHEDWLAAEQDLLFALNYEIAAYFPLDGTGPRPQGRASQRSCRFCERSVPTVTFEEPPLVVPAFLGNSALVSRDVCDDCGASFRENVEGDLERFTQPFLGCPSSRANGELVGSVLFGPTATHLPVTEVPTRPFVPIAAFKAFVRMGLAIMHGREIESFEDAIEWVSNPDHEFDARAFHGLACLVHALTDPVPIPWVALARRTDPGAPVPFMLFFLGTGRVVFQIALPLCSKDEDLEGEDLIIPRSPSPLGLGQTPGAIACAVVDLSSADLIREVRLKIVAPSNPSEGVFALAWPG